MSAAAAEGGVKPLQNAMKMAKNAIQLDGEREGGDGGGAGADAEVGGAVSGTSQVLHTE
uniref:Uncharacterized protein n=1 Tax=Cynoglossus semilaevis TaxID=244447 RepID=A0A3P8X2U9_CYNSE